MEAISPELVLVDPALARRMRTHPEPFRGKWETVASDAAAGRPLPSAPARRGGLVPPGIPLFSGLLLLTAAAAVLFSPTASAPVAVSRSPAVHRVDAAPAPAPAAPASVDLHDGALAVPVPAPAKHARPVARPEPAPVVRLPSGASVEQRVLAFLQRPGRPLPVPLRDSRTGLLKSGVQAVCSLAAARDRFLCIVSPPGANGDEGLFLAFRVAAHDGSPVVWYGYRSRG